MYLRYRLSLWFLLPLLAASACQPVPRPFARDPGKSTNRLLAMPDAVGVAVRDVAGMPAPASHDLSVAMAAALLERDVPASTISANRRSFILRGRVAGRGEPASGKDFAVVWELADASGRTVGARTQRVGAAWGSAGPGARKALAGLTAERIAGLLRGPSDAHTSPQTRLPPVYVAPVTGAPETANRALRGALRAALRAERIEVSGEPDPQGLVVTGRVVLGPAMSGLRSITVDWTVSRTGGTTLGQLTQRNVIDTRARGEIWEPMAEDIADGAAQGMLDLLRHLRRAAGRR